MIKGRVLIVDDKPQQDIPMILKAEGYETFAAGNGRHALQYVRGQDFDVVLTDFRSDASGIDLLGELMSVQAGRPVILMTSDGITEDVVTAIRQGAFDVLAKPLEKDKLLPVLQRAMDRTALVRVTRRQSDPSRGTGRWDIVGSAMDSVLDFVDKVAASDFTVLILGESGTGKEMIAQALHHRSLRGSKPFVAVSIAALPDTLVESELFGHEAGAFTDARAQRRGCFELADGGTLFLDEIGELTSSSQVKLLRVLQTRKFTRLGGTQTIEVDVRVIAATNKDLEAAVKEGTFRADLYYRIAVIPLVLPPLRERRGDIQALVAHFIAKHAGGRARGISVEALDILRSQDWPGNVRQLESVIQLALAQGKHDEIRPEDLRAPEYRGGPSPYVGRQRTPTASGTVEGTSQRTGSGRRQQPVSTSIDIFANGLDALEADWTDWAALEQKLAQHLRDPAAGRSFKLALATRIERYRHATRFTIKTNHKSGTEDMSGPVSALVVQKLRDKAEALGRGPDRKMFVDVVLELIPPESPSQGME